MPRGGGAGGCAGVDIQLPDVGGAVRGAVPTSIFIQGIHALGALTSAIKAVLNPFR